MTAQSTVPASLQTADRPAGQDFAELRKRIRSAGLLRPRPWAFARSLALVVAALALCWTAFATLGVTWWQLAVAGVMGMVFTQVGFLGHDVGHHQVSRSPRLTAVLGLLLGNAGIGLSFGWWTDKHDAHHAHPNDEDRDPDVSPGALVWTGKQARRRAGLTGFLTRWQAFLFLPMLLLEGLSLHVASFRATRDRDGRRRWGQLTLLAGHVVANVGLVLWLLPLGQAVAFLAVQQAVFGLTLGLSFAPNHKGMPIVSGEDALDHFTSQVRTARNVRSGPFVDVLLGGLNFQIEHHLFPSMPRSSLRRAQPIVREFCRSRDVPYVETGLLESYRLALRHLHAVGVQARRSPA
jgi:fatty acid desaturase